MSPEALFAGLDAGAVAARLAGDPLAAYALAAAGVLAFASLVGGLARGEAAALTRPGPWAAAGVAALGALALTIAGARIDAVVAADLPLEGLRRLPLYLVALGYGPLTGAVGALLFAAVERTQGPLPAAEAVLVLEMAVVGWLAIAPSPRRSRLAAPFDVALGWALASATGGLAALAWTYRPLPIEVVAEAVRHDGPGVALAVLLVALPGPRWWRRAAPGAAPGIAGAAEGPDGAGPPPLERAGPRRRARRVEGVRRPRGPRRAGRRARRPTAPRPEPLPAAAEPGGDSDAAPAPERPEE